MLDLTDKQKNLLRWIVQEVRNDNLPEAAIRFRFTQNGPTIENYAGNKGSIPTKVISQQVLDRFRQLRLIETRGFRSGGEIFYECTLTQKVYDAVDFNFSEIDRSLGILILEPEQKELLSILVEASRNVPRHGRQKFMVSRSTDGDELVHDGLKSKTWIFYGDAEILANERLVDISVGSHGTPLLQVTPLGYKYYEYIKQQVGQPSQQLEAEVKSYITSDSFKMKYPKAYQKWVDSESQLWSSESESELTTIGHLCREAMQEFAEELVNLHRPSKVDPNIAHTVARIKSVINKYRATLGKTVYPFLEALVAYWGTVNDLVQRQEHGGQKEGEAIKWNDARRVVFQTIIVMYEIDRSLH